MDPSNPAYQFFYEHDSVRVGVVVVVVLILVNYLKTLLFAKMDPGKKFPHDFAVEGLALVVSVVFVYLLQLATPAGFGATSTAIRQNLVLLPFDTLLAWLGAMGLYAKITGGIPVTPAWHDPRVQTLASHVALSMGPSFRRLTAADGYGVDTTGKTVAGAAKPVVAAPKPPATRPRRPTVKPPATPEPLPFKDPTDKP